MLPNNPVLLHRRYSAAPSSYALDGVSNVKAAYSLRRLSSSYSGSAIRVRRSSDSTEQDIGFSGENFDDASFSAFIGGGSGFVRKIYDQSGAGNDLGQATAGSQPQVTLSAQNSHPVMTFDGTDDALFGAWSSQLSTALTAEVAAKMSASFKAVFDVSDTGSLNVAYSLRNSGVNFIMRDSSGNQGLKAVDTSFHQFAGFFIPSSLTRILVDGVTGTDGSGAALVTADQCCLGALLDSSVPNTFFLSGTIGEAIFINADLTGGADATLRANQKTYWGTP